MKLSKRVHIFQVNLRLEMLPVNNTSVMVGGIAQQGKLRKDEHTNPLMKCGWLSSKLFISTFSNSFARSPLYFCSALNKPKIYLT